MITLYKILKEENDEVYAGEFKTSTEVATHLLEKGINITSSSVRHAIKMYDEEGINLIKKGYVIKDSYKVFKILD